MRFALLLPVAELLLSAAFLWPMRLIIVHELHISLPPVIEQTMVADCRRWSPKQDFFLGAVVGLNIPAGIIQLPYSVNRPGRKQWSPAGMNDFVWRAVSWPFVCLPFWWIAGRAIDALRAVKYRSLIPRIRLMEAVIGSIWVVIGALLFLMFLIMAAFKKDAGLTRIAAAGGLWALLGALSLIARFRQNRLREQQHAAATAATA
jgi:hypothetical protein